MYVVQLRVLLDHLGDATQVAHVDSTAVHRFSQRVAVNGRGLVLQALVDLR